MDKDFLIWSNEHNAWWSHNNQGYTKSKANAGRYSYNEAVNIVEMANLYQDDCETPNETILLCC